MILFTKQGRWERFLNRQFQLIYIILHEQIKELSLRCSYEL